MRRWIGMLIFTILCSCFVPSAAAAVDTIREALPSTATMIVNGKEIQFQAYEMDGYNYLKVRDLAAAFAETRQQFVPENRGYSYSGYDIGNGTYLYKTFGAWDKYQPIGDELQMGDKKPKEAVKVHAYACVDSTIQKREIMSDSLVQPLEAFSIEDYTYIKLRDLAAIFDFGVRWNSAQEKIEIDTEIPYLLSEYLPPPRTAEKMEAGWVYESEQMVFINEMPIMSYAVELDGRDREKDVIYIAAEDLENYGFDVSWDAVQNTLSLSYRVGKMFGMLDGEIINGVRSQEALCRAYTDNIRVLVDGREIGAYSLDGKMLIPLAELYPYGIFSYGLDPDHSENPIKWRINLDILKRQLSETYEKIPKEKFQMGKLRAFEEWEKAQIMKAPSGLGRYYFQADENDRMSGMVLYEMAGEGYDPHYYKFIGFFDQDRMNGEGIYINRNYDSMAMYGASEGNRFERGTFRNGNLYDGIQYNSASMHNIGSRVEGAMENGYQRQSVIESHPQTKYRFGYRLVCEGEVQEGEFCGYYRRYDASGKLVFEGQYSDYLAQQEE